MTQVGNVYGQALYSLAKDEGLSSVVLEELKVLKESFSEEPEFLRLLAAANLSKDERCRIMIEETEKIRRAFMKSQIGKVYSVIFETSDSEGYLTGHTANFIPVKVKAPEKLRGEIKDVLLTETDEDFCIGEIH